MKCGKRFGLRKRHVCARDQGHEGQHRIRRTLPEVRRAVHKGKA